MDTYNDMLILIEYLFSQCDHHPYRNLNGDEFIKTVMDNVLHLPKNDCKNCIHINRYIQEFAIIRVLYYIR